LEIQIPTNLQYKIFQTKKDWRISQSFLLKIQARLLKGKAVAEKIILAVQCFAKPIPESCEFPSNCNKDTQWLNLTIWATGIASSLGAIDIDFSQPCLSKPVVDVFTFETKPEIGHLFTLPFVIVAIQVSDAQHPARLEHLHHLFDGGLRIRRMMQVHVGKDTIQAFIW